MDDPLNIGAYKEWEGKELPPFPGNHIGFLFADNPDPVDISETRRSAYAVGDYNPLWCDAAYAEGTRFGGAIAAPHFYFSIDHGLSYPPVAMPAASSLVYSGADWEFFRPLHVGDVVTAKRKFLRIEERESKFAGQTAYLHGETTYYNQRNELLARGVGICALFLVGEAKDKAKYKTEDKFPTFSEEMLATIQRDKQAQKIRGAEPRYFEDVNVGDVLQPVVQGPLWMGEVVNFFVGSRRWGPVDYPMAYPKHPEYIPLEPIPDPWTGGHSNNKPGQAFDNRAMPRGFDVGYQRIAWLLRLASAWIGDAADLKSLSGRLNRPNFEGDVSWYTGEVIDKRVEDGEHLVECSLTAHNQDGRQHTEGSFIAALPTRK